MFASNHAPLAPTAIVRWPLPAPPRLVGAAACARIDHTMIEIAALRALAVELEGVERDAYRSLFEVAAGLFGRAAFQMRELHGATVFLSPLVRRPGVFNRVLGWGLRRPAGVAALHALLDGFDAAGCLPAFDVLPPLLAADVSVSMRALRIRKGATGVVLRLALDARCEQTPARNPAAQLQVRPVQGANAAVSAALCAEVFAVGHPVRAALEALGGEPGWQHWLALVEGEPAGAALSFTQGERCWFGWAATRPRFRGRGVKGALDDARIAAARAAGCRLICTDTATGTPAAPDPSMRSLVRRGFAPAYRRATYLCVGGTAGA